MRAVAKSCKSESFIQRGQHFKNLIFERRIKMYTRLAVYFMYRPKVTNLMIKTILPCDTVPADNLRVLSIGYSREKRPNIAITLKAFQLMGI